jgi:hypothetical protein
MRPRTGFSSKATKGLSGLLAGGAAAVGAGLLANGTSARAQERGYLNAGDVAILRFLAAAELIESDLWIQYAELGGIGDNKPIEVNPNQQKVRSPRSTSGG